MNRGVKTFPHSHLHNHCGGGSVKGSANVKLSADSAGISICLFPVTAPPIKPAPAPASAPMPAPLPPPAKPPINAPPAAPPPVVAAVLLPLPFCVLLSGVVWISYVWSPSEMLARVRDSWASPLILPFDLADTTVPLTVAPVGRAL